VALLDARRYDEWIELFVDDCVYRVVARENDDRGLPLATLGFESKGMLQDRIYGITQTLFHEPYYQRHLVSSFCFVGEPDGTIAVEANYLVVQTKAGEFSRVFSTGRYRDRIVRAADGTLRFKEKVAVFDSELIANSLIYPL
jgi:salicylate 5-hydroxylase small subunit